MPFRDAVRTWVRVAVYSFGGPASQIAVMHKLIVQEKRWITEERFLHALNYAMLLPGPEAQQLAIYIGWILHGVRGGLVAGILFVIPGFLCILALSMVYVLWGELPLAEALLFGLKAAVLAVVVEALWRIGGKVLKNRAMIGVALLAFLAIFFAQLPFPVIVAGAGLVGWLGSRWAPASFVVLAQTRQNDGGPGEASFPAHATRPSVGRAVRVAAIWLAVWFAPLPLLIAVFGADSVFTIEAVFFSKTAVVTFGGAYAVLAYIAQQAVELYGWLLPGEMLDGLGMAETTPGPLIQVVQFVGFLGAFRNAGALDPMVAGVLGSVVTTWFTFAPCFLWIFLGAPYIEHLRGYRALSGALSTITAAVVGVILNLVLWFFLHVVFGSVTEHHVYGLRLIVPDVATLRVSALIIAAGALLALLRWHWGMLPTLAAACVAGVVARFVAGL